MKQKLIFFALGIGVIVVFLIFTAYLKEKEKESDIDFVIDYEDEMFIPTFSNVSTLRTMEQLLNSLYTVDETAYVTYDDLNVSKLIGYNFKTDFNGNDPKILIFHTHSQEAFIDSREGVIEDTIVGVGRNLAKTLVNQYGIGVVHDIGRYDVQNGSEVRSNSYERMEQGVKGLLDKYPSIEVLIDLHRDGVPSDVHLVTEINGEPTAKIMFFNGITRLNVNGEPRPVTELPNPYLDESLAFALQSQLKSNELYPDFTRKIYIKPYRYSLHLKPKSLLVEVGANTNTVAEANNAMKPLAEILAAVLKD